MRDVTEHAASLRRAANALETADDRVLWTPSHLLKGLKDTTGGPGNVRAGHARPPVQPVAAGY